MTLFFDRVANVYTTMNATCSRKGITNWGAASYLGEMIMRSKLILSTICLLRA